MTKNEELRKILEEITEGKGAYSMDHLTHTSNTIDSMKSLAKKALVLLDATVKETVLESASMSKNCQTYIIPEARPHLGIKRGELCRIEFVLRDGKIFIRKAKK